MTTKPEEPKTIFVCYNAVGEDLYFFKVTNTPTTIDKIKSLNGYIAGIVDTDKDAAIKAQTFNEVLPIIEGSEEIYSTSEPKNLNITGELIVIEHVI